MRVGKVYNTESLRTYLPHYTVEGGSEVVKHGFLIDSQTFHPIPEFKRLLESLNTSAVELKSDTKSIFYIGSNGMKAKPVYTIHLTPPSNYEFMDN